MAPKGAAPKPKVGYLGPEGTFSEEALLSSATADSVEPVPRATIYDTVMALRHGEIEWAVVPIENSLDGSISVTLDLLAEPAEDVQIQIVGETLLTIKHSLIAHQPVELNEIDTVLSHPQVPGQCVRFLRGELAHARVVPASSTAEAVREVVEKAGRRWAALGTSLAAEIYGGTVIRKDVQDRDDNATRFVWLAGVREGEPPSSALAPPVRNTGRRWRTSLVFWGAGAERPGWLLRCLDEMASREINLTKIESRPRRGSMGDYMFFADLDGGLSEQAVSDAVEGLRSVCEEVRVLGSYPAM